jgi:hypothetical protein
MQLPPARSWASTPLQILHRCVQKCTMLCPESLNRQQQCWHVSISITLCTAAAVALLSPAPCNAWSSSLYAAAAEAAAEPEEAVALVKKPAWGAPGAAAAAGFGQEALQMCNWLLVSCLFEADRAATSPSCAAVCAPAWTRQLYVAAAALKHLREHMASPLSSVSHIGVRILHLVAGQCHSQTVSWSQQDGAQHSCHVDAWGPPIVQGETWRSGLRVRLSSRMESTAVLISSKQSDE